MRMSPIDIDIIENLYETLNFDNAEQAVLNLYKSKLAKSRLHIYKITPPIEGEKSRWQTYVKMASGRRKKITAMTEMKLYEKLIKYYSGESDTTLGEMYPSWIKEREHEVKIGTVQRNAQLYKKYYENEEITNIPVCKITKKIIKDFYHKIIEKNKLTKKGFDNMRFLIRDMLRYAVDLEYISNNPSLDVYIKSTSLFPEQTVPNKERVYTWQEMYKLFAAIDEHSSKTEDMVKGHGIKLLFYTGVRLGELVALKKCDIDFEDGSLHVRRMETIGRGEKGKTITEVVEHTKLRSQAGDRIIAINLEAQKLLAEIIDINNQKNPKDEFIFQNDKGRMTRRMIDGKIRDLCNKAGIQVKSAHDMRRTYATTLFYGGVPIEQIAELLGHSDTKTTKGYIIRLEEEKQDRSQINGVLSDRIPA